MYLFSMRSITFLTTQIKSDCHCHSTRDLNADNKGTVSAVPYLGHSEEQFSFWPEDGKFDVDYKH